MTLARLATAAVTLIFVGSRDVGAQPVRKVPTVGYLSAGLPTSPFVGTFVSGLRDLGYVEGSTVTVEMRYAAERLERLPTLASELVARHVDVIVAVGGAEARAALGATRDIPIVTVTVDDPISRGLAASLAKPGGNVTGLMSTAGDELHGKRLELLKEMLPGIARVGILADVSHPAMGPRVKATAAVARKLGVELREIPVGDNGDLESALDTIRRERIDALLVPLLPSLFGHLSRIVDLAAKSHLPAMYDVREYVDRGGLVAYGPVLDDLWRRAAIYVDKILKGAKPRDLPIEQPTKFELVINLRTAKSLGLRIPPSLLVRADQVIE